MYVKHLVKPLEIEGAVVTVGTFDGVHLGHASVVNVVLEEARNRSGASVVVTFDPHPRQFIDGAKAPALLTTADEKQWRLAQLGVDVLAIVPFDERVRQMHPHTFVSEFLVEKLGAQSIVVGYDHGFGRDRKGDFETMQALGLKLGFEAQSVSPTLVDQIPISSTRIRTALSQGDFDTAIQLLGGTYPTWGKVIRGEGRGQSLGFPTANLQFETATKQLPPPGVYAGWAYLPKPHAAVLNFGRRPTFGAGDQSFEVHILDFSGDLYGRLLRMDICHLIRQEKTFGSREELVRQIQRDINQAKALLSQPKPIRTWR